jgi:tetratricopeptide (TPR) repeat protein
MSMITIGSATVSRRKGIVVVALLAFLIWLAAAPSNRSVAMIYKGDSHFLDGRYGPALQSYLQAESLRPGWWRPFLRQGMVLEKVGRYDEAIAAFDKGLLLQPWDPELITRFTSCLIKAGQYKRAREVIRRRMSLEPGCMDGLGLLARASAEEGDYREADRFLGRALEVNPYNPGVHFQRAMVRQHFDLDLAIESCHATLGLGAYPEDRRSTFLLLGNLYRQQGKTKESEGALQALLATYPRSPEAQTARALLSTLE